MASLNQIKPVEGKDTFFYSGVLGAFMLKLSSNAERTYIDVNESDDSGSFKMRRMPVLNYTVEGIQALDKVSNDDTWNSVLQGTTLKSAIGHIVTDDLIGFIVSKQLILQFKKDSKRLRLRTTTYIEDYSYFKELIEQDELIQKLKLWLIYIGTPALATILLLIYVICCVNEQSDDEMVLVDDLGSQLSEKADSSSDRDSGH